MSVQRIRRSKGPPRLDAAQRLMSRFYEPLVLLHVLDRNGEQRSSYHPSAETMELQSNSRELRRNFLNQLAYSCDYKRGGDNVTAIALEAQPSGVTFWIASNSNVSESSIHFLKKILDALRSLASLHTEQSRSHILEKIIQYCFDFNRKRINDYQVQLQRHLRSCLEHLNKEAQGLSMANWLKIFQGFGKDLDSLCRYSYEQRNCKQMKDFQRHIGDIQSKITDIESVRQSFQLTRHYIGRLGSHVKAARILVATGTDIPSLFENFSIKSRPSLKPARLPPPTDSMTTLDGILRRMLPANSEDFSRYQEALEFMDSKFNILNLLLGHYEDKDFRPRVHAELILLEFFYRSQLPFVDDDRFIGCSKPACYCCYHYISSHPGGFVRPSSHGIRYISWRPPDFIDAANQEEKKHQRDVMNKVIAQVRLDTLQHIDQRKGPSPWHPDSTTGITDSQRFEEAEKLEKNVTRADSDDEVLVWSTLYDASEFANGVESSDSEGGVVLQDHNARPKLS